MQEIISIFFPPLYYMDASAPDYKKICMFFGSLRQDKKKVKMILKGLLKQCTGDVNIRYT